MARSQETGSIGCLVAATVSLTDCRQLPAPDRKAFAEFSSYLSDLAVVFHLKRLLERSVLVVTAGNGVVEAAREGHAQPGKYGSCERGFTSHYAADRDRFARRDLVLASEYCATKVFDSGLPRLRQRSLSSL